MKKQIFFMAMAVLLIAGVVNASEIVTTTYEKSFVVDATSYPHKSCNIESNYESGNCQYLYACYVVVPRGSTDIDDAVQRECVDITDTKKATLRVSFAPPRGVRWAVSTFLAVINYTYNTGSYTWQKAASIPLDYRSAEEVISLCADGQMLKYNLCYEAQSVCLDTFSTNLCDNPYQLYVLNYGFGFDYNNQASYCADRDLDLICDETVSFICSDTNNNGVCDSDDLAIQGVSCTDANQNYVCDDVEAEGTFCRTNFDPVHCGEGESCITYPNKCFAEAAGCTAWTNDTCEPVYTNTCYNDADCTSPCEGVTGLCKNPEGKGNACYYAGECNPRVIQCSVDTDCPPAYCTGVVRVCTSTNTCVYDGKCITQPSAPSSFWDMLRSAWLNFITWLSAFFTGGGGSIAPVSYLVYLDDFDSNRFADWSYSGFEFVSAEKITDAKQGTYSMKVTSNSARSNTYNYSAYQAKLSQDWSQHKNGKLSYWIKNPNNIPGTLSVSFGELVGGATLKDYTRCVYTFSGKGTDWNFVSISLNTTVGNACYRSGTMNWNSIKYIRFNIEPGHAYQGIYEIQLDDIKVTK